LGEGRVGDRIKINMDHQKGDSEEPRMQIPVGAEGKNRPPYGNKED
jgi:hypothetical protein